jgi:hypothetical protein
MLGISSKLTQVENPIASTNNALSTHSHLLTRIDTIMPVKNWLPIKKASIIIPPSINRQINVYPKRTVRLIPTTFHLDVDFFFWLFSSIVKQTFRFVAVSNN